jgi:hypothetical protein
VTASHPCWYRTTTPSAVVSSIALNDAPAL